MACAKKCELCKVDFSVPKAREKTAKFCSRECSDKAPKKHHSTRCRECGKQFRIKKSQSERNKVWGSMCSPECRTAVRKRFSLGASNPNFKGRNFDQDGYKIYTPQASLSLGLGKIKVHHAVAFQSLGIKKLPSGMHIHHRDCDITNNEPWNLAMLTASNHKWLHKQFGSATLNAYMRGKVTLSELSSWCDDPVRAESILLPSVLDQGALIKHLRDKGIDMEIGKALSIKPIRVEFVEESNA